MQRVAFKMKLNKNCIDEYKKRHDALWPELETLLTSEGIREYSIFVDANSNDLFGYLKIADAKLLNNLPEHEVMKKWWSYMKDIMETNEDNSPLSIPLQELFYLP
ncbi:MAG: L-rhamnose mutarotase [Ginsengibacter sp.]